MVESAHAASHSLVSQVAPRSSPLVAACDWQVSGNLGLEICSGSRGMSVGEQGFASERLPKLCAQWGCANEGTQGFEPPGDSYVALEVGVLQGGWVMQQQEQEQEHASSSSSSSSNSRRRARDPQLRVRGVCVPVGCMCARMGRSEPQPSPAAPAHAAWQPVQSAQYCARSSPVESAGSTGRSAGAQRCRARETAAESSGIRHECILLLSMWRSGRMIHPPGHLLYII